MKVKEFAQQIDVRKYEPRDRHTAIHQTFESLAVGEKMELINDHNPKPLFYEFQYERRGTFTWDYLEEGPDVWRVSIGKIEGGN